MDQIIRNLATQNKTLGYFTALKSYWKYVFKTNTEDFKSLGNACAENISRSWKIAFSLLFSTQSFYMIWPSHCHPGIELIPKKWKFEYKLFDDFIIWKTDIEQNKNFQIGVVSPELWFIQSWPMMPSFVCITISGLMIVASMKTHKLKLPYILNTKADFQKLFLYYRYIPTLFENAS